MLRANRCRPLSKHTPLAHRCNAMQLSTRVVKETSVCILGGGPVGLLLSSQLSAYGIKHCIVERRSTPTHHPQAHFMNARTMEILQAHVPRTFHSALNEMPSSKNWRDFVYCYSVAGRHFARVDHFKETSATFWDETPSNIVHLPQNKFEVILRKEVFENKKNPADLHFGYDCKSISFSPSGSSLLIQRNGTGKTSVGPSDGPNEIEVKCDYLVAADGANSLARRSLSIPLIGEECMHTLMNIHFTCHGLLDRLQPRPAMLYFSFNEGLVSVFVAHDPEKDEWVCQIPIFPPFRNPEDFDEATVQRLLRKGLGFSTTTASKEKDLVINVLSINSWVMHAQVADTFTNNHENVFLAGDAAHRFPPAGGFGMNTGLQDAHNIAWKLASVISGNASKSLLSTYQSERKPIAQANTDLSMENYEKSASVARMLGVDPVLAKIAIDTAKSSFSSLMPLSMRKVVVNTILDVGLSTLALLARPGVVLGDVRVGMVKRTVDKKQSLPLIFPAADIDFDYSVKATSTTSSSSKSMAQRIFGSPSVLKEFTAPLLREGGRVPHCWFFSPSDLSPLGGYSPHKESTANSSVDRSKPNQDRIQDLTDDQSITSSVSLSAFLNSNRMANATDPGSLIPKVIILVDASNFEVWAKAVERCGTQTFQVIAVVGLRAAEGAEEVVGGPSGRTSGNKLQYVHHDVQKVMQNPFYQVQDKEENESHPIPDLDVTKMRSILLEHHDSTRKGKDDTVYDFTGRWMETCEKYEVAVTGTTSASTQGYSSVAIRPDGHVSNIFPFKASQSLKDAIEHLISLKQSLHIISPPASL